MSEPRVSVIIPCYNNGRYLGAAIESVFSQDVSSVEVIVVDDGSTDDSATVAVSYEGVLLVGQENQGVGVARNQGLAIATGTYLALLDADDWWAAGKLAAQLAAFELDPSLDLVFAEIQEFISDDLTDEQREGLTARPGRHQAMLPSTVLMTRAAHQSIGGFADGKGSGEALDWALRVGEVDLNTAVASGALVHRRLHASNSGREMRDTQRNGYLAAVKR